MISNGNDGGARLPKLLKIPRLQRKNRKLKIGMILKFEDRNDSQVGYD